MIDHHPTHVLPISWTALLLVLWIAYALRRNRH